MKTAVKRLGLDPSGATSIEYALIASLIAVFIVTAVEAVGVKLTGIFLNVASLL